MPEPEPPTVGSEIVYVLRRELAACRRDQIYRLSMLRDTALIAAIQVIEVRLAHLEEVRKNTSVPMSEILLDAAVASCLGIAGPIVRRGMQALFDDILRSRAAFAVVPKTDLGQWISHQLSGEATRRFGAEKKLLATLYEKPFGPAERASLKDVLKPAIRKQSAEFSLFKKGFLNEQDPRLLYHAATFKAVDATVASVSDLESAAAKLGKFLTAAPPVDVDERDTPAVRVMRSAVEFFTRQIETQQRVFDELDLELSTSGYTRDEAGTVLAHVIRREPPTDDSVARDMEVWIRYFEQCIWVGLYPDIGTRAHDMVGVPTTLQEYLIRRLFTRAEPDPDLGRPRTYLEQAIKQNRPNQDFAKSVRVNKNLRPIAPEAGDMKSAIRLLSSDWREVSAELRNTSGQLYRGTVKPGAN